MKAITFIINSIFLLIMLGVAGLFLMPYLPVEHGWELRIVESGSMEPAIMTGALIAVQPQESYAAGDVIMFESRYADVPTTHRVLESYQENGRTWFVTMGDANEEADAEPVPAGNVIGAVAFDVPRVGFVLDFARQPLGFALLIVLPAVLIVIGEIEKIWRELRRRKGPVGYRVPARDRQRRDRKRSTPAPAEIPPAAKPVRTAIEPTRPPVRRPVQMMDIATPAQRFTWPTLDLREMTPFKPTSRRWLSPARVTGVLSVVVFSVLVWSAGYLGTTVSYFNDIETSIDNLLAAIALDVQAVPDGEQFNFLGEELVDDDGAVVLFVSPEPDTAEVLYDVMVEETGGPASLCAAIEAESNAPIVYNGPLLSLSGSEVLFGAPWSIQFSLPDDAGLGDSAVCTVDIVLTAWHFDAATNEGYYDEERVPLVFNYADPTPATIAPLSLPQSASLFLSDDSKPTDPELPAEANERAVKAVETEPTEPSPEPEENSDETDGTTDETEVPSTETETETEEDITEEESETKVKTDSPTEPTEPEEPTEEPDSGEEPETEVSETVIEEEAAV